MRLGAATGHRSRLRLCAPNQIAAGLNHDRSSASPAEREYVSSLKRVVRWQVIRLRDLESANGQPNQAVMPGQRDQFDQLLPAEFGHRLGILRVRESPRSQQSPRDLDEQSIAFGQPVERPVRPHGSDCLLRCSLLVGAVLVACPGIARLHFPRRDQDHQLTVSARQFAIEAKEVL
jgi:hypothetical protein